MVSASISLPLPLWVRRGETHRRLSEEIFRRLYDGGYLRLEEVQQFYDEESGKYLNGRQVTGRCPIAGCRSESAYADECSLGHQYSPNELIQPVSVTTGKTPILKKRSGTGISISNASPRR